jgi:hypothetical protein
MEQLPSCWTRQFAHRVTHRFELHAIERREVVLILDQEIHVAAVHAIVDCGFDVKHVDVLVNEFPDTNTFAI